MESTSFELVSEAQSWRRKKAIALLLAIVVGPWAWLYTYRKNAWKAAIGIPIFIGFWSFLLSISRNQTLPVGYPAQMAEVFHRITIIVFALYVILVYLPIWIWAIVDICKIKDWSFAAPEIRDKTAAILLAVFLSPWTWFYTYRTDRWKFWVVIIISYGYSLVSLTVWRPSTVPIDKASMLFSMLLLIFDIGIKIWAIVEAAVRPPDWYQKYGKTIGLKPDSTAASNEG